MCAKYTRYMFLKIAPRQSWHVCLTQVKIRIIFGAGSEDEKLIKKANLHENWNMQTLFYSLSQMSSKSIIRSL